MQRQQHTAADIAAIRDISTAVQELLKRLQDVRDPISRALLSIEFYAEIDGLQERLTRCYRFDEEDARTVIARSLAHVSTAVRAAIQ